MKFSGPDCTVLLCVREDKGLFTNWVATKHDIRDHWQLPLLMHSMLLSMVGMFVVNHQGLEPLQPLLCMRTLRE